MLLTNRDVVGSDAHRTTLRHISTSYTRLFGPPLIFTTPNIADTRNLMVSLMYEGASVQQWRLLEETAPVMPSTRDMLRRVAADPVSQAMVTNLMLELFLEHVVGVKAQRGATGVSDGVAATGGCADGCRRAPATPPGR